MGRARKRLVVQAKDKYNSPRFRFIVRFSNQFVTCQVISATMAGDEVLCSAHSSELGKYGVVAGLKNYAAAYCTGLLCARRLLTNIKFTDEDGDEQVLSDLYEPAPCDGQVRSVRYGRRTLYVEDLEWETERRPFRCNLDVGVKATTLGSRLFGALKGASDGGLDIPHSHKRFPGYSPEKKKYNAGLTSTEFMVCTWPITCGSCRRMMLPSMPSTSPCTSRPARGQMRSRGCTKKLTQPFLKTRVVPRSQPRNSTPI